MANDHQGSGRVTGTGSPNGDLTVDQLDRIVASGLESVASGSRILAIVPDKTRDDNTNILLPAAARKLSAIGVSRIDVLVAQGTHPPMSDAEKLAKIGADQDDRISKLGEIFDHHWDNPNELVNIGELSSAEVHRITGGILAEAIPLTVNRLVGGGGYDSILVFGATMPHEVAGFAGGAKYFFPGIAGPELTHKTHWLSALASVERIIGRVETPTRHLIEAAADQIKSNVVSFTSVVSRSSNDRLRTHALFAGDIRLALREAADISRHVHIKYTGRKFARVVAILDEHYEDLWVGGKASYRLGGVIEEGGELIIFAPRLRRISDTHGDEIVRFGGYAPLEIIKDQVANCDRLAANLCVAAHLSQVAYAGRIDENGNILKRFRIVLASQVDAVTCRGVNLDYMNVDDFRLSDFENDPDTLVVNRAGRDLYLVEPIIEN